MYNMYVYIYIDTHTHTPYLGYIRLAAILMFTSPGFEGFDTSPHDSLKGPLGVLVTPS